MKGRQIAYQLHSLKAEPRSKAILLTLTPSEHADLKEKCAEAGISVSAALRGIARAIIESEKGLVSIDPKREARA